MHPDPNKLRRLLADNAAATAAVARSDTAIQNAAGTRREAVEAEMAKHRPTALTDPASGEAYLKAVAERGQLDGITR
jgi:hypothetical protein